MADASRGTLDQALVVKERNQQIAQELLNAASTGLPVQRLSARYPELTVDDAYAIQTLQLEAHLRHGRVLAGRKVGLTSLAMQRQLGVDSPDFGYFFSDMVHGDGAVIPARSFIAPKVEPEFAFVLAADLRGPGVTVEEAGSAIAVVHPAIEIIDSRIADWDIGLVDTIADNASCGAIVIGRDVIDVHPADLGDVTCRLLVDGEVVGRGSGNDVMGNPIVPLAWLANVLGERGVGLRAGDLVLPGAFMAAAEVPSGFDITADFGELGSVTIAFGE